MRRQFRVPMAVIAGGLLGLIALLATLQYRWLGQISGAERERMKATLHTRATAFGQDIDRELTRAYLLFQVDSLQPEQSAAASLAARYDRWLATSRFPRMVKDIYIVPAQSAPGEAVTLQRYDPATRFIQPAEWPESAAPIRKQIEQPPPVPQVPPGASATLLLRGMVPAVWPSVPALVVQSPMLMVSHLDARSSEMRGTPKQLTPSIKHTIVILDAEYMRNEMLPALAQLHFNGTNDAFEYQLAVLPAEAGQPPLYRSTREFSPSADAKVDANVQMFQVRARDFEPLAAEVSRFATLIARPKDPSTQRTHTIYRETIGPTGRSGRGAPLSIVVQESAGGAPSRQIDRLFAAGAATTFNARVNLSSPAYWHLLVKHRSGSLEAAVNAARRRNLIISSSVLGVLGLSVGFLVVSTRRAHALARQQLEFVATVSHELRTPLAVIRSAADNLADGVVNDERRIRQYGQLVRREGLRLTDLVEQILEFAGLESGQRTMTARPVEIGRLLREVVATTETVPSGVHVEMAVAESLPAVAGDEAALRRVFQNLIGNAIKYGATAGWIGVSATQTSSTLDINVSDRGIGIAAADQSRIFDPFYRAPDVVAAQIQGAGLGLSLVKRIVEAHGGRITLKSAPGQGSTFTVSLPIFQGDPADGADRVGDAAPQVS
jgi:two-component system, OmpR family, sensor histidine kinase SenX3